MKKLIIFLFAIFVNNLLPSIIFINKAKSQDTEVLIEIQLSDGSKTYVAGTDRELKFDVNGTVDGQFSVTYDGNEIKQVNIIEIVNFGYKKSQTEYAFYRDFFIAEQKKLNDTKAYLAKLAELAKINLVDSRDFSLDVGDKYFHILLDHERVMLQGQKSELEKAYMAHCVIL